MRRVKAGVAFAHDFYDVSQFYIKSWVFVESVTRGVKGNKIASFWYLKF